jgi:UDP-N-acetyl-D-glucosamine dehydrogenase
MSALAAALLKKIETRTARTGVVGLGYVGLPLAVELARSGFHATGIDLDERKISAIKEGRSYIPDVTTADVMAFTKAGKLDATSDFSIVKELDTINICVPTPLRKTKDPDMSYIVSAVEAIAKYLHKGMLIVLESTTYPGTTDEVVQPILEATGLKAGTDFFIRSRPSAWTRVTRTSRPTTCPRWSAASPPNARSWRARCTGARSRRSCR